MAAPVEHGAPPLPNRRPRVREVSSRFMSPSPSSSSVAGDLHSLSMKSPISRPKHTTTVSATTPKPFQRRLVLRSSSQEHDENNIPDITLRSFDNNTSNNNNNNNTPFHHHHQATKPETLRKQQPQPQHTIFKRFKENGDQNQIAKSTSSLLRTTTAAAKPSSRSDTPIERVVPSRFRIPQRHQSVTDAAKLLQSNGLSFSSSDSISSDTGVPPQSSNELESTMIQGGSCPNSPLSSSQHTRNWETRSSMAGEEDTLSTTRLLVRNSNGGVCQTISSSKLSSTPSSLCSRSLNLPMMSVSQSSLFKSSDRITNSLSVESRTTLPPQPSSVKLGVDSRKGRKPNSSQEDAHSLKLLHNHFLMWRFANAKAQVSMDAQRTEMENQFFSLGADISRLRDAVKRKQVELAVLQQINALSTILEAQMPYLDEWSALEEDYACSLSGATNALTNSLLRLPVTGNVQVNIKEAAEALDSSVKTMDTIVYDIQRFLPKAEEMDVLMSELATIADVEKALVEECGNILANTHTSQVEDCSLRGHLMQLRCCTNRF